MNKTSQLRYARFLHILLIGANLLICASCATVPKPTQTVDISDFDALPDAVIITHQLARLPKDTLAHPWLKEILTEDFINYYETNERRLSIQGILRRLSYEHHTTLLDGLLTAILNNPAEIALWKSYDGKLRTYLMIMRSSGIAAMLQLAGTIEVSDTQLSVWGEKTLADGTTIPVYKLRYSGNRELYIAPGDTYTYIFPDAEMDLALKPTETEAPEDAEKPPDTQNTIGIFSKSFGIDPHASQHTVIVTARYASFGYQQFFPALKALRFDYRDSRWTMAALTTNMGEHSCVDTARLWQVVPHHPALAVAVPVEPTTGQHILASMLADTAFDADALLQSICAPVVISWYPDSTLYTPLFIAYTRGLTEQIATLRTLFEQSIEPITEEVLDDPQAEDFFWTAQVRSKYGIARDEAGSKSAFFKVALAYYQGYLIFSPDSGLVEKTLNVLNKTYPAVADSFPSKRKNQSLVLYPEAIAQLLKTSVSESLPVTQEPLFRESVSRYLFPRLDIVSQFPAVLLSMPVFYDIEQGVWEELEWQELASPK